MAMLLLGVGGEEGGAVLSGDNGASYSNEVSICKSGLPTLIRDQMEAHNSISALTCNMHTQNLDIFHNTFLFNKQKMFNCAEKRQSQLLPKPFSAGTY